MKRLFLYLAVSAMFCCCSTPDRQVYYNALVYTADQSQPEATAFVVEGDRITFVGDDSSASEYAGKKAEKMDQFNNRVEQFL